MMNNDLSVAYDIMEKAEKYNVTIITPDSPEFPQSGHLHQWHGPCPAAGRTHRPYVPAPAADIS